MKLFLCLLTSHDLPKLSRLIKCVVNANPTKVLEVYPHIIVNTLNDRYYAEVLAANFPFPVIRTESNGLPGKGKNSCAELFLESDCDYLCQYDGDDLLYPTYAQSLERHVVQYPSMDVLGIIPADTVRDYELGAGSRFTVEEGKYGSVWSQSLDPPPNRIGPPSKGGWVDEELPWNDNYIILQSKRSAIYKIREDLKVGEDALYCVQLLKKHIEGKIGYFLTMSSDMKITDGTTENSIQKQHSSYEAIQLWKNIAKEEIVDINRSSFNELPIVYFPLLISAEEKIEWTLNNF